MIDVVDSDTTGFCGVHVAAERPVPTPEAKMHHFQEELVVESFIVTRSHPPDNYSIGIRNDLRRVDPTNYACSTPPQR